MGENEHASSVQDPARNVDPAPRVAPRSPSEAIKPMVAPPPPPRVSRRRRGGLLSALSAFFTFIMIAVLAFGAAVYLGQRQLDAPGPLAEDKAVVVRGGGQTVAETLRREGVIEYPLLFVLGLYLTGKNDELKAGEYLFKRQASLREVMDTIASGRTLLHPITLPEGLTSEQIVARLMENDLLTGQINEVPAEGTLLPETYKVARGTPRQVLIDRMKADQKRVVQEIWANRDPDLPLKSPEELVILASIVEKETGVAAERPRVAAVFVNRLRKGMKLQSDPTIVYGLVGGKGKLGRGIKRSEINQPTPYNTYVIPGLPPGPIANPGRDALQAAARPSKTNDLYFVADGSGGHAFAETLDEHNRNVQRWRKIEAGRPSPGAAPDVDRVEPDEGGAPPAGDPQKQGAAGTRGPKIYDASEGTPKDPLRNKTFDLTSPKVVPDASKLIE